MIADDVDLHAGRTGWQDDSPVERVGAGLKAVGFLLVRALAILSASGIWRHRFVPQCSSSLGV